MVNFYLYIYCSESLYLKFKVCILSLIKVWNLYEKNKNKNNETVYDTERKIHFHLCSLQKFTQIPDMFYKKLRVLHFALPTLLVLVLKYNEV